MKILSEPAYTFDDVLLVPQQSNIKSRNDVDLSTKLGSLSLRLPILSANMDTVTEGNMAVAMGKLGGGGVLHRFAEFDPSVIEWVDQCVAAKAPVIISVGVTEINEEIDRIDWLLEKQKLDAVCLDVAHGDSDAVFNAIRKIRESFHPTLDIIAGNVATASAASRLVDAGASIIKVGIGPGSVCSTRIVTGHGVPQLTAIMRVAQAVDVQVIADGGIRYPGDIVKALAAGADAVMLGSLLAGTDEAAGERIIEDGVAYKTYRGMASYAVQKEKRQGRTPRVEGVSAKVPYRGPVSVTIANLEAGIRSGLSYSGALTLSELRSRAEFVVVTANSVKESHPHIHHPYRL